jgi:hypothetical protein
MHSAAGGLFAIAQRGVEEDDLVWIRHRALLLGLDVIIM